MVDNNNNPMFWSTPITTIITTSHSNPSSSHAIGQHAHHALQHARQRVADALGANHADEIVFCSCGTEANNLAIWGVVMQHYNPPSSHNDPPHVISSTIEHPAVLEYLKFAQKQSWLVYNLVPVNTQGLIDPADVAAALRPTTKLVSIMHANNEMGAVQDLAGIVHTVKAACAARKQAAPLFHSDAAQSFGKMVLDKALIQDTLQLCTIVGHKIGAPKGVAVLYVQRGVELVPMMYGGGQERGVRPGTENVMLAVGMGAAAEVAVRGLGTRIARLQQLRESLVEQLQRGLQELGHALVVHGPRDPARRLPHVVFCTIPGVDSGQVLRRVGQRLAASAGAACHGGSGSSGALQAMGIEEERVARYGALRLSVGSGTSQEDVDDGVDVLLQGIRSVMGGAGE